MTDTEKRILAEKMFSFENYLNGNVNYEAIIDNMITFEQECRQEESPPYDYTKIS